MAGKVTGIVIITVNDNQLQSEPGASLSFGGLERTLHMGHKPYGHSNKYVESTVECVVADKFETDIIEMNNYEDAELTFESDNGKRYLVANAATAEPCKLTDDGGGINLKMTGDAAVRQ